DPATSLIVLLSKPPASEVAARLRAFASTLATPVQFAMIGPGQPDLTAAAEAALRAIGQPVPDWPRWPAVVAVPDDPASQPGGGPASQADDTTGGQPGSGPTSQPGSGPASQPGGVPASQAGGTPGGQPGSGPASQPGGSQGGRAGEVHPRPVIAKDSGTVIGPGNGNGTGPGGSGAGQQRAAGALRGLFAGGTLCDEAMVIAASRLGEIRSNIPLRPSWLLNPLSPAAGHAMIDFGDDELTAGRPHPMIDQTLRLDRLAAEAADPATAVILLDVVLGHGAHPDPAAELGPAIAAALASRRTRVSQHGPASRLAAPPGAIQPSTSPPGLNQPGARDLAVVVSLIGARSDPQGLVSQALALQQAGAHVFASNAQAARFACDLIEGIPPDRGGQATPAGQPPTHSRPESDDQATPGGRYQAGSGS
ncbi:MAG TPA: hypothetical protein VN840_17280, partial [Streptosporangiaceae bacterium]|nr:hypothetical protein [Streptosporangiaceae bacterium]